MKTQNEYRQEHIQEMSQIQEWRRQAAKRITDTILTNYTTKQILQIMYLLEEWRSIIFTEKPKSPILDSNIPIELQRIIDRMYPKKRKSFIPNGDE